MAGLAGAKTVWCWPYPVGVDSMVMLRLMNELNQLRQYNHLQLVVAHFNHKLRPESDYEATAVKILWRNTAVFILRQVEPATTNVEAQARDARYQFCRSDSDSRSRCFDDYSSS